MEKSDKLSESSLQIPWHHFHSHAEVERRARVLSECRLAAQRLALQTPQRHSRLSSPDATPKGIKQLRKKERAVCRRMRNLFLESMRGRYASKAVDQNKQHVHDVLRISAALQTMNTPRLRVAAAPNQCRRLWQRSRQVAADITCFGVRNLTTATIHNTQRANRG